MAPGRRYMESKAFSTLFLFETSFLPFAPMYTPDLTFAIACPPVAKTEAIERSSRGQPSSV